MTVNENSVQSPDTANNNSCPSVEEIEALKAQYVKSPSEDVELRLRTLFNKATELHCDNIKSLNPFS
jgi:hypothetical protein